MFFEAAPHTFKPAWAFEKGTDVFCPYYRDLALCLVAGFTPRDVFLGLFGKAEDPNSGGRQMPAHWSSKERNIITGSSPIATQVLHRVEEELGVPWEDVFETIDEVPIAAGTMAQVHLGTLADGDRVDAGGEQGIHASSVQGDERRANDAAGRRAGKAGDLPTSCNAGTGPG